VLVICAPTATSAVGLMVNTTDGAVQGKASTYADGINSFTGIYFAESTAGMNRFMSPIPKKPWAPLVHDATQTPPGCPQHCNLPPHTCPMVQSEDCLSLNVFAPSTPTSDGSLRPVMFFIHGGDFRQGYGAGILYDGSRLANHGDVVVVTTNYRLGVQGFLKSTDAGINGNFGIEDQRLAMQWASKNVQAFGGDPTKITIFGQSAGGVSVGIHVASPLSQGLFRAAILQSNPLSLPLRSAKDATKMGDAVFKKSKCVSGLDSKPDRDCLQNLPLDELTTIGVEVGKELQRNAKDPLTIAMSWAPWVGEGSTAVSEHPFKILSEYKATVPLMMGSLTQEGVMFVFGPIAKPLNKVEYSALLGAVFGIDTGVEHHYPAVDGDNREITSIMATDYIFRCVNRNLSTTLDSDQNPVYLYEFSKNVSQGKEIWGANYSFCDNAVCHGEELAFEFDVSGLIPGVHFTDSEQGVSQRMMTRWTNFAKYMDPNPPAGTDSGPEWKPVGSGQMIYNFNDKDTTYSPINDNKCNWWDTKGYAFP